MTLHLLRGFVQWNRRHPDGRLTPIGTVEEADAWVRCIAGMGFGRFWTRTSRRPARAAELEGGSVFFVGGPKRNQALFRLPFLAVEESGGGWAILMRPELVRVRRDFVGRVRGWRYLKDEDAPPDMQQGQSIADQADMPAELAAGLKEAGLL